MKNYLLLSFVAVASTLFAGCATRRQIHLIERVTKDTIYLNKVQYDSIYIDKAKYVDRTRDTLLSQDKVVESRDKRLRATSRIHQIDSIPVIREVEVIKEVPRPLPWYDKICRAIAVTTVLALVMYLSRKIR